MSTLEWHPTGECESPRRRRRGTDASVYLPTFFSREHFEFVQSHSGGDEGDDARPWRLRDRTKTTAGLLIMCLNIGTDPPDRVLTPPCARLEAWTGMSCVAQFVMRLF